jgi:hypothetical protein
MKQMRMTAMLIVMLGAAAIAGASTFDTVMEHYEPVRLALMGDSMEGVNEHGAAIAAELRELKTDFSADEAGVSGEAASVVQDKLDAMIAAADGIAKASSLQAARDAFYQLSMPLVRWHDGVSEDSRPAVAYCPMHKKSWLQPDGQIGNPYGGMPRCGEIVSR